MAAQLRKDYSDDPSMVAGALEFEMGLHRRDVERESLQRSTTEVLALLAS